MTASPRDAGRRVDWRWPGVFGVLALVVLLFGLRREFLAAQLDDLYLVAVMVTVAAVAVVGTAGSLRLWSSGFLFAVLLAAFHFGIPITRLLGIQLDWEVLSYTNSWFRDTETVRSALWLCVAALLGFALGYLLLSGGDDTEPVLAEGRGLRPSFAVPGMALVVIGAAWYMGYAAAVAPSLFLGGGKDVYEATIGGSGPVASGTALASIGIIIAAAAPPSMARTWAFRVFVVFALFTLLIGSRTAALYAIVAVVVAAARVRTMPRSRTAILMILGGLLVVSSVEQIRGTGWADASVGDYLGSPLAGLHEMGASLRPVVETVAVVEGEETDFRHGLTYVVTPLRAVEEFFGIEQPIPEDRWAAEAIADRSPGFQIGYSMVAEAYLNFGPLGTFLVFTVLGAAFGWWDNRRLGDPVTAARVAVVFVALVASVRAGSNVVLVTMIFGLLMVQFARWWSDRDVQTKDRLPPAYRRALPTALRSRQ